MDATHISALEDQLRGAGLVARALPGDGLLVFFDDEFHERHDYDIVGPKVRSALAAILDRLGWRRRRATRYESPEGLTLVFPRPAAALSASPLDALLDARDGRSLVASTPTQVLMLGLEEGWGDERLEALVAEMPANLPKIEAWVRGRACASRYRAQAESLKSAQRAGLEVRRRRRGQK